MSRLVRAMLVAVGLALAGWIGVGIYNAGSDVPPPPVNPETKLTAGFAEGRHIGGYRSWSLDYDRIVASADTTVATLENVRHGELYRHGKPFMQIQAKHVVVNTLSNDFIVTGPMELIENDGLHARHLVSDAANYSGILQTLTLSHPATITGDGAKVKVKTAIVDFRSGDLTLGPMVGVF